MRKIRTILALFALGFLAICCSAYADCARCVDENQACQMSNSGHNMIRYGSDGKFFFIETEGSSYVGCGNDVFGDPARGASKHCDYSKVDGTLTWTTCGSEGGTCTLPNHVPRYVRYGAWGRGWAMKVASSSLTCSNDEFPDLAPGSQKSCQYSNEAFGGDPVRQKPLQFRDCGSEYSDCQIDLPTGAAALLRFGKSPNWEYRLASVETFPCSRDTFNADPANGQGKFCEYSNLPTQITAVTGYWQQVGTCVGCPLLVSMQFGVSGSHSTSRTHSWTNEVSTEISQEFKLMGQKGTVKATYKHSDTVAEAVSDALTTSESTTKSATCPNTNPTALVQMFQWKMNIDETCLAAGMCRSSVDSFNIVCSINQPPGYEPACPPTMCANDSCTVCKQTGTPAQGN